MKGQGFTKNNSIKIQRLMNKCARIILDEKRTTSTETLMDLMGWLPLNQLVAYSRMILMLKMILSNKPRKIVERILRKPHEGGANTRNKEWLKVPKCTLDTSRVAFATQTVKLLNAWMKEEKSLYDSTGRMKSMTVLKRKVKDWVRRVVPTKPNSEGGGRKQIRERGEGERRKETPEIENEGERRSDIRNYFKPIKEQRDSGYERGDIRNFFRLRGAIETDERDRGERGSQEMNGRGRPPERRR